MMSGGNRWRLWIFITTLADSGSHLSIPNQAFTSFTHTGPRLDTKCGGSPLLGRDFQPLVTKRLVALDKLAFFTFKSGNADLF